MRPCRQFCVIFFLEPVEATDNSEYSGHSYREEKRYSLNAGVEDSRVDRHCRHDLEKRVKEKTYRHYGDVERDLAESFFCASVFIVFYGKGKDNVKDKKGKR